MQRLALTALLMGMIVMNFPLDVQAGAGLDQRLRAVQQQREAQQRAILQQRQAAVAQRRLQQQQVQVMTQQMARQQAEMAARQRVMQQQLARQAVGAQQAAYQQQVQQARLAAQSSAANFSSSVSQGNSLPRSTGNSYPTDGFHVEEVVEMKTIWEDLEISSQVWPLIIDMESKEVIVAKFMEDFRSQGITFRKSPMHYAQMIDSMSFDNPELLNNSFEKVLQMVAIVEYDFNNGMNPDELARRVLGEQAYQQNKQRLGR